MRRALTAIVAGGVAAWLSAAEPAPASAPPAEDPIAAAKRDFDQSKAERASGAQGKPALPRFDLPEMPQPGANPGPPSEAQKKKRSGPAEKKSANWLLEAMERKPDGRESRGRDETAQQANGFSNADDDKSGDGRPESVGESIVRESTSDARAEAKTRDERDARRAEPAPNPLSRFIGEWMTPQDYALMKPVVDAPRTGEGAFNAPNLAVPGGASSVAASAAEASPDLRNNARPGFNLPTPQENPYLQQLNSSPSPAPAANPPLPNPTPVVVAPPAPVPESKHKVPDFAKPLDDQKYFKQLKRF